MAVRPLVQRHAAAEGDGITERELKKQLQAAVKAEDFTSAAKLRDQLQQLSIDSEAAVLCANQEFYAAFEAGDAERMASLWLENDRSCCVHPGSLPIHGYEAIKDSWANILGNQGGMRITHDRPTVAISGGVGRIVCFEKVGPGLALVAVNLYESTEAGWKIWYHQAGPVAG